MKRGHQFRWAAFWFRMDNITDLTDCKLVFYKDESNYASIAFESLVDEADEWFFIREKLEDFTKTGNFDWTEVNYVKIAVKHSSEQTYYFLVDELCFIE
jgi:hypothetical protein